MNSLRRVLGTLSFLMVFGLCHAFPIQFTATLSGLNENPANVSPATGTVLVFLDPAVHTLQVNATFSGLLGTTTASHIHAPALPGTNAGVATQTPTFTGFPLGVTSGTYNSPVFDLTLASSYNPAFITANGGTVASAEAALVSAMLSGMSYFNIHSSVFGGGEVRANLSVPESDSAALLLVPTLLGLIVARRKWHGAA